MPINIQNHSGMSPTPRSSFSPIPSPSNVYYHSNDSSNSLIGTEIEKDNGVIGAVRNKFLFK